MTLAAVRLWGTVVGAVSLEEPGGAAVFQYTPEILPSGIELSPIVMPLREAPYSFGTLARETFHGLPGLLADSLPDRYGNALIDAWLARQGRAQDSFDAVERLCYTGARGMGALEYEPQIGPAKTESTPVEVSALVELATEVLTHRERLTARFGDHDEREEALRDILRVGTSAGGARAKAIIAWNPSTNEVRSGEVRAEPGFGYWLLKFDGVEGNRDRELDDPKGYCGIEYAYSQLAKAAGITMSECRLLEEHGRRHFMTRRFDRTADGDKVHMQTLCGLAHFDFNVAGAYSYEQALMVIRQLGLPMSDVEEQYRRMVFNVAARNQDDHVKNIAFLMDRSGRWSLSPAYDLTYAYNPRGRWTSQHQMTINGKRDGFTRADLRACAAAASMKRGRADAILDEVLEVLGRWDELAAVAGVDDVWREQIGAGHCRTIPEA
ncbi:MAG: type II toxin-antitoxin system HipA family toxin [Sandaracinaceae bacterium]